jgi:hypothetical protein
MREQSDRFDQQLQAHRIRMAEDMAQVSLSLYIYRCVCVCVSGLYLRLQTPAFATSRTLHLCLFLWLCLCLCEASDVVALNALKCRSESVLKQHTACRSTN